ncbi:MAG: hypothetical protein VYB54_16690 [Pseudomonadota bacterium]|nr:hypothetical protein [Pseudomonadota bacterium]
MNRLSDIHEDRQYARGPGLVGIGLYSLAEAARLLGGRSESIRRWMTGYKASTKGGRRRYDPIWSPDIHLDDGAAYLSFRDLMELRVALLFIGRGVGLHTLRLCHQRASAVLETDRPFSSARFRTDGRTIFLDLAEEANDDGLMDLRLGQWTFRKVIEPTFRDLDFDGDRPARWRPYDGRDSIVVDPERSFGQPIANASGVPTATLARAVNAEGSIRAAAAAFEVPVVDVRDAVAFEERLAA